MKKNAKDTKTPGRARTAVIAKPDLAAVLGGTNGTIIVQNALPVPRGTSGGA